MYAIVRELVPDEQIAVIHANLGRHEWTGIEAHIRANIAHPLHVVRASKTFSEMVRHRAKTRPDVPSFPSASQRQCTSDLKRVRRYTSSSAEPHERARQTVLGINCIGTAGRGEPIATQPPRLASQPHAEQPKTDGVRLAPGPAAGDRRGVRADPQGGSGAVPRVRGGKRAGLVRVLHLRLPGGRGARPPRAARTCTRSTGSWSRRPDGRCSPGQSLAERCDAGNAEREAAKTPTQRRLCW